MTHDPMVESVLIRYPKDDKMYPDALMSVHPNNGMSSVDNAKGVHPGAKIIAWESSNDPYDESPETPDHAANDSTDSLTEADSVSVAAPDVTPEIAPVIEA